MKFGVFVHYVWGGTAYPATVNPDGSTPAGLDDLADRFDAVKFADDLASVGAEYVIFTAWHANMNCLWPSAGMRRWLPGHASRRDLLRDMIRAVRARGIRVVLYAHPTDGHDLTATEQAATGWGPAFDRTRWNNFINDLYGDLVERYGRDLTGIYLDEHAGKNGELVDYPRLRATLKTGNPDLLLLQNDYGRIYNCDLGDEELYHLPTAESDAWPARSIPSALLISQEWWASKPGHFYAPKFSAESLFRYTVLKAAVTSAGGVALAAGNYPGGGWERGVLETLRLVAEHIRPVGRAITNTYASTSYPTSPGATIKSLEWGVATRSIDGSREFLHVLNPPAGKTLRLPPPADGRRFRSARLLPGGRKVSLIQDGSGLALTLSPRDTWAVLDTVIELDAARRSSPWPKTTAGSPEAAPALKRSIPLQSITVTNASGFHVRLSPTPGMVRWFDAAGLRLKDGAAVVRWNDISGNEAHAVRPLGQNQPPKFCARSGTGTGLGAVHFGAGSGSNPALDSEALTFRSAAKARTVVSIFKGAGFLLTDYNLFPFHRADDIHAVTPLWSPREASPNVLGGTTCVNGTAVDGTVFAMPTNRHNGFNIVTVITTNSVRVSSFNRDRSCHAGDQYHAEVLIYDFPLTDRQRRETEAYLRAKWFGELPSATGLNENGDRSRPQPQSTNGSNRLEPSASECDSITKQAR